MSSVFSHFSAWSQKRSEHSYSSSTAVEKAVSDLNLSQKLWSQLPVNQRKAALLTAVRQIECKKSELAQKASEEMGKPLAQAQLEVQKCIDTFMYVLEQCDSFLPQREEVTANYPKSWIEYVPRGVVLAIMPWNFPFWQICRASVFSLVQGNVILFKYSELVPESSKLWASCFSSEYFKALCVPVSQIASLIQDSRISSVTLTGSVGAGQAVAALCAPLMKHSVLELGGSDVHLVFADAQLDLAAEKILRSRTQNNGQSCIAAKRVLVHRSVRAQFLEILFEKSSRLCLGEPLSVTTEMSVLASTRFKEKFEVLGEQLIHRGGQELWRGEEMDHPNFFPLRWVQVEALESLDWRATEFFCPLGMIDSFETESEAVLKANCSDFGLAASVYSGDFERAQSVGSALDVRTVVVNDYLRSDVRLPFSGEKLSGLGYELGAAGAREFLKLRVLSDGAPGASEVR
jgi:succinate-semialdehyde dehydrogenase/glutarate-semialdehyde dehydrogenase